MLFGTYEDEPIKFSNWQIEDLHDYSRVRIREKSPQIGFSWLRACEAVHNTVLFLDIIDGFVSVDQREAQNKIMYARKLYDGLPQQFREWVPLIGASSEELRLGEEGRPSIIASYPATSGMRGRRMSVTIDEADFMKDGGKDAFRAGITRVMRSKSLRLTMGSTCWGQDTEIDRLMQGVDEAGVNDKRRVQSVARYPHDVVEREDEREGIELARQVLTDEDFDEEYRCIRGGTANDPFPADLIRRQTHPWDPWKVDADGRIQIETQAPIIAGYDVGGGSGNPSVISILEQQTKSLWRQMVLYVPKRDGMGLTLPQQEEWLTELMHRVPRLILYLDAKGIGLGIAQKLQQVFGLRRVQFIISGAKPGGTVLADQAITQEKDQMILGVKTLLESGELELLQNHAQAQQFKRTRRSKVTKGKFDQRGDRKETHFDLFWATTHAAYGVRASGRVSSTYSSRSLTVLGGELASARW